MTMSTSVGGPKIKGEGPKIKGPNYFDRHARLIIGVGFSVAVMR